jgi:tol-pal system protein YbgF
MLKSRCFNVSGKTGLVLFVAMLFPVFLMISCATTEQPKEDYQLTLVEKQVSEMEKKIDEIHHRVSVIQFMVDNHERYINDLENDSGKDAVNEGASESGMETGIPVPTDAAVQFSGQGSDQVTEESIQSSSLSDTPNQEMAMAEPKPQPPPIITESPQVLYRRALSKYKNADYKDAALLFESFVTQFPTHELADNSRYWEGECMYAVKDFSKAITAFQRVVSDYPEGSKVPDAMLKTGYSYLSLGDRENARIHLKKVVKNYPFSPSGTKAEMMLKKIR